MRKDYKYAGNYYVTAAETYDSFDLRVLQRSTIFSLNNEFYN